jgi:WD40 repeat protein
MMNVFGPLLKMWTKALLLSSSAVSFFVVTLGIGIVPYKSGDIWQRTTLSITDCCFHDHGRVAISAVWTHNFFGRVDHLVVFPLDDSAPTIQIPWRHLSPRVLASDPIRGLVYVGDANGGVYSVDPKRLDQAPVQILQHPSLQVRQMKCSKDGRWLVSIHEDALFIWDLETQALLGVWAAGNVHCVALTDDSQSAICGLEDGSVVEIDLATVSMQRIITKHTSPVVRIAVCPLGQRVASLNFHGGLHVHDAQSDKKLWQIAQEWSPPVLEFSSDGQLLLSSGHVGRKTCIMVYRASSGARLATLAGQENNLRGLAMNRHRQLVSWGADGTLRIWDASAMNGRKPLLEGQPWLKQTWHGRTILPQWRSFQRDKDPSLASNRAVGFQAL